MIEIKLETADITKLEMLKHPEVHIQNTLAELYRQATNVENAWKQWAYGADSIENIKPIPKPSIEIAKSIKKRTVDGLTYTIYSDSPRMADYQNGKDEVIDMKKAGSPWLTGKKSRINKKDGSPYLIVPFSWGTSSGHFRSIVPKGIQKLLTSRALSYRTGKQHIEKNARGEDVLRNEYTWGGRISKAEAQHTDDSGKLTGYDVGMVRMADNAYKGRNHGTYFTFRILSAKARADKWIQRRHIERIDVVGGLEKAFEAQIKQAVQEAFLADFEAGF